MPRSSSGLTRHSIFLSEGTIEKLQELYPELGASAVIRELINKHIATVEAAAPVPNLPLKEISI